MFVFLLTTLASVSWILFCASCLAISAFALKSKAFFFCRLNSHMGINKDCNLFSSWRSSSLASVSFSLLRTPKKQKNLHSELIKISLQKLVQSVQNNVSFFLLQYQLNLTFFFFFFFFYLFAVIENKYKLLRYAYKI